MADNARFGHASATKTAPFRRIPADIFAAYEIPNMGIWYAGGRAQNWRARANLFSIRVAAAENPVKSSNSSPRRKGGRTKGSGSLDQADAPLLLEMRELIRDQKAFSPDGAAKLVASKAKGGARKRAKQRVWPTAIGRPRKTGVLNSALIF